MIILAKFLFYIFTFLYAMEGLESESKDYVHKAQCVVIGILAAYGFYLAILDLGGTL